MRQEVLRLINPQVRSQADRFRREFVSTPPFPHVVIDDFLDPELCRDLSEQFPSFDPTKALNEYGEVGGKAVYENIRPLGSAYRRFDDLVCSKPFLRWLGEVTDIGDLVYDPDYYGGGTHDNQNGQGLDLHVDFNYHPLTGRHRRLNMIVFLNPDWQRQWGGSLKLQANPWLAPEQTQTIEVVPVLNRCALFATSEKSWHGFDVIRIPPDRVAEGVSRRSLSVYFYSDDRPEQEIAPEHSTVYIPPPLPSYLVEGHTISEQEAAEIHGLVARRDHQIRFLYEREKEWSAERSRLRGMLASIDRSPTFRLARALARPLKFILRK